MNINSASATESWSRDADIQEYLAQVAWNHHPEVRESLDSLAWLLKETRDGLEAALRLGQEHLDKRNLAEAERDRVLAMLAKLEQLQDENKKIVDRVSQWSKLAVDVTIGSANEMSAAKKRVEALKAERDTAKAAAENQTAWGQEWEYQYHELEREVRRLQVIVNERCM